MPKRSSSSERWLRRQRRDPYSKQAQAEGNVSRAHYKLQQLDQKYRLLKPHQAVLELGAAPGGWTGYVATKVTRGLVIAVDPKPITAPARVVTIEGQYGDSDVIADIGKMFDNVFENIENSNNKAGGVRALDLVLSDMAPNITGVRVADQAAAIELADLALDAAGRWLKRGGALVVKSFQGEGLEAWVAGARTRFERVNLTKPKASRSESREVFVVARNFDGRSTDGSTGVEHVSD